MYQVTAIRLERQPPALQVISEYYLAGRSGEQDIWVKKPDAVDFVRANYHSVYVAGPTATAWVDVVDANPPYLRTEADGTATDNLLSLPGY